MNNIPAIQDSKRILGVFAHPDDESFCAGGTFAKYVATGAEVMVVSATRGEAGQIRMPSVATRRTLGAVREQELHLACQRLGIQHTICLDHMDGALKDVDQEVLIRQVTEIIRTFRPDVVITFGPDGGYGHPDHIAVSAATTAACIRSIDKRRYNLQQAPGIPVSGQVVQYIAKMQSVSAASARGLSRLLIHLLRRLSCSRTLTYSMPCEPTWQS